MTKSGAVNLPWCHASFFRFRALNFYNSPLPPPPVLPQGYISIWTFASPPCRHVGVPVQHPCSPEGQELPGRHAEGQSGPGLLPCPSPRSTPLHGLLPAHSQPPPPAQVPRPPGVGHSGVPAAQPARRRSPSVPRPGRPPLLGPARTHVERARLPLPEPDAARTASLLQTRGAGGGGDGARRRSAVLRLQQPGQWEVPLRFLLLIFFPAEGEFVSPPERRAAPAENAHLV